MKTRAALVLAIAGILVAGSAALAVNTQTLNNAHTGTTGNADRVLLPDGLTTATPAPPDVAASLTPTAEVTSTSSDDNSAPPSPAASPSSEPGDDKGGLLKAPEPGDDNGGPVEIQPGPGSPITTGPSDDKGGLLRAPEPGDDSGGHGGRSGGGSDD
jgi:hypothetical protein